jgi:hypothetical protein
MRRRSSMARVRTVPRSSPIGPISETLSPQKVTREPCDRTGCSEVTRGHRVFETTKLYRRARSPTSASAPTTRSATDIPRTASQDCPSLEPARVRRRAGVQSRAPAYRPCPSSRRAPGQWPTPTRRSTTARLHPVLDRRLPHRRREPVPRSPRIRSPDSPASGESLARYRTPHVSRLDHWSLPNVAKTRARPGPRH